MNAMHKTLRIITIAVGVVAVVVLTLSYLQRRKAVEPIDLSAPNNLPMADYGAVGDFSLTSQENKPVSLSDLKGHVWIANFIFTRCMGPCPVMSSHMSQLKTEFTDPALRFVSFSVDPEFDTPKVLSDYAKSYKADSRWLFLTGESKKVYNLILESFKLAVEQNTDPNIPAGERINHSLHFVLVDKEGHVRGYYNGSDAHAMAQLRENIKKLG